jgi:hypothetical protein
MKLRRPRDCGHEPAGQVAFEIRTCVLEDARREISQTASSKPSGMMIY